MLKRPSEHRLTLEERVAVVVAIMIAVGFHVAVFLVGGGIGRLTQQEKKRERLMVIRRVREITPAPDVAVRVPDPRRVQVPAEPEPAPEKKAGGEPPKPEQKLSPRGTLPAPPKAEISPVMEADLQASIPREQTAPPSGQKGAEVGDNSVSVVTDLPAASFTVSGPVEYRGTGTFWIRRGAPAGTYRVAFSVADGFGTPPPQTKQLQEKGQIVFIGKYRRSTEVVVETNVPAALFTIYRPDGRALDLSRPGRAFFDDLQPGTYTAVFKDIPGYITPAPASRTLAAGGSLSFSVEYRTAAGSPIRSEPGGDAGAVAYRGGTPAGRSGAGGGSGSGSRGTGRGGPREAMLDRRVQLVVTSTPKTGIEEWHSPIAYPEVAISKSNFQAGWCQVYLVVKVDSSGEVEEIIIERPSSEKRAPYEALINAVEESVREWDYDRVKAEVHVDARFYVE